MSAPIDNFDLSGMRLTPGEGRQLELAVRLEPFTLGDDSYPVEPAVVPVRLDISRTTSQGYALRVRFEATLQGPCMRCLEPADAGFEVDAREISQPGSGDELDSPYVGSEVLDLGAWARDALALNLPRAILCRPDCAGLCAICGENLNTAGAEHQHEAEPDPRWAKLSEIKFD
jgi:uncharacterized protein